MRLYATATGSKTNDGRVEVRIHLTEAETRGEAIDEAANQHKLATTFFSEQTACVEVTAAPAYGKLKVFAVSTLRMSEVGVPETTLTVVTAHSREIVERDVLAAIRLTGGPKPDRIDLVEIPRPNPYPPMAEWVKAACINPHVGGPLLAGVIDLLCRIDRERAFPAEAMFGEGPVARLYAGLQMVERAWHELPTHRPDDPNADAPDGH